MNRTALNEVESPVIIWVQALGPYLQYLEGVSVFQRRTSLVSVSPCTKIKKFCALLSSLSKPHT